MGEDDWDPSELSFVSHMIAGSMAGLAEHVAIFPIDTLKTHVQCERCGTSSWNCAVKIIRREGLLRMWRGVSATFMGCLPAHAAYFSVYESMKTLVGANNEGHHPLGAALCGATAAFSHDIFMTPLDTVKQRMQLGYYKSNFHCMKTILKEEGIRSFYRSFPTTVLMNLPYGCIMVATNESVKKVLSSRSSTTRKQEYDFFVSMFSGSVAGSVAAAITNPLDVIKTRLQTHNLQPCPIASNSLSLNIPKFDHLSAVASTSTSTKSHSVPNTFKTKGFSSLHNLCLNETLHTNQRVSNNMYKIVADVVTDIIKEDGYKGFLRGIFPRVIVHAPSVAISWTVYEGIKHFIADNSNSKS